MVSPWIPCFSPCFLHQGGGGFILWKSIRKSKTVNMCFEEFWLYGQIPICTTAVWNISRIFNLSKCPRACYWSIWYQLPLCQFWDLYHFLCNCIDIHWTTMKRTKFHCDSRISEQRCFCPAMKNVCVMCLTWSKPGRVESPPSLAAVFRISSLTPKCHKILKRNFLTLIDLSQDRISSIELPPSTSYRCFALSIGY